MDKKEHKDRGNPVLQKGTPKEKELEPKKIGLKNDNLAENQGEKKSKKPMSEEGKRITKKIEEMTGIKLLEEDEVTHKQDDNVDNSASKKTGNENAKPKDKSKKIDPKPTMDEKKNKEALQNVKDVDFGEGNANKPLIFKCPNDLRVTLKKDSGEYVIDEDCCTAISILVKNTGEIATNFSGAHSHDLIKILEKSLKKYLKELKKTLKKEYKTANDELTLSQEPLDEEKKWNETV